MDTQPSQFTPSPNEGQNNFTPSPMGGQPEQPTQHSKFIAAIPVIIAILAIAGAAYWYFTQPKPVACTQEAKQCSDGSYVSRTGANCEFAACPVSSKPAITVLSPNGGETFEVGKTYQINWSSIGLNDSDKIYIDLVNSAVTATENLNIVVNIASELPQSTTNFNWSIPPNVPNANDYKIRVAISRTALADISDTSNTVFSIASNDSAANWQTYRNEEFGFEVKYFQNLNNPQVIYTKACDISGETPTPQGCAVYTDSQIKFIPLFEINFPAIDKSEYNDMRIKILTNENLLSLADWYNDYSKKMFVTIEPTPPDQRININVAGTNGYMMNEDCCQNIDFNSYIAHGDKIFVVSLNGNVAHNNKEQIKKDLNQILSTFRFTK